MQVQILNKVCQVCGKKFLCNKTTSVEDMHCSKESKCYCTDHLPDLQKIKTEDLTYIKDLDFYQVGVEGQKLIAG
jgi:hypothetical protein